VPASNGWRASAALGAISLILSMAAPAGAGSGPASLACTAPGLSLKGQIPATESALNLTLSDGTNQVTLLGEQGDAVQVVDAFDDRVFTLTVTRKAGGPPLRLYARPGSMRVRRETHGVYARFQAVLLQAPKPAPAGAAPGELRAVKLACQYDYEI
jgi:hypothetical protein